MKERRFGLLDAVMRVKRLRHVASQSSHENTVFTWPFFLTDPLSWFVQWTLPFYDIIFKNNYKEYYVNKEDAYLKNAAAVGVADLVDTGLVHSQGDAIEEDDSHADPLEPRATRSRRRELKENAIVRIFCILNIYEI